MILGPAKDVAKQEQTTTLMHQNQNVKAEKVPMKKYAGSNQHLPSSLPIIGLGCSSFSTFFSSTDDTLTVDTITKDHHVVKNWIETIRHAVLIRGICLLDTAPWYGHGTSERVVGFALDTILNSSYRFADNELPILTTRQRTGSLPRSDLILNTKVGRYEADPLKQFDFSYSMTIKSVIRSLERMNCDYIDVLQLHDPEFAPNMSIIMNETIPALLECKKRGWTKAIGLTGYPLEVQHEILVKCSQQGGFVFDQALVYCHNNLHDMSLFNDSSFPLNPSESDTPSSRKVSFAEYCYQHGIKLICAAPFSMGLLTNSSPPNWHPASSSLKEACAQAAALCRSKGVDISSLAVLYGLSQVEVGCTLIGMKDIKEVDLASDLAVRFSSIDFDQNIGHMQSVLDQVLTNVEREALFLVLDQGKGPFVKLQANGEYRWNGKAEAENFWTSVRQLHEAGSGRR